MPNEKCNTQELKINGGKEKGNKFSFNWFNIGREEFRENSLKWINFQTIKNGGPQFTSIAKHILATKHGNLELWLLVDWGVIEEAMWGSN